MRRSLPALQGVACVLQDDALLAEGNRPWVKTVQTVCIASLRL